MAGEIVRAAIYCRMSTAKQEDSIDRQLANVRPYAERKGYVTADEHTYADEGIAGDEFLKRTDFQRLLKDAAVAIVPGEAFGTNDHVRISYATSMQEIERGMDRLQKFVGGLGS